MFWFAAILELFAAILAENDAELIKYEVRFAAILELFAAILELNEAEFARYTLLVHAVKEAVVKNFGVTDIVNVLVPGFVVNAISFPAVNVIVSVALLATIALCPVTANVVNELPE